MNITSGTMNLHRYKCSECGTKSFLHDFKYSTILYCPACGEDGLIYDKEVELLLEKGNTRRKVRYIVEFQDQDGNIFYVDTPEPKDMRRVKRNMIGSVKARCIKTIQHFGLKR